MKIKFFYQKGLDALIIQRNGKKREINSLRGAYDYIYKNGFPDEFSSDAAQMVLDEHNPALLFFYESNSDDFEEIKKASIKAFKVRKESDWGQKLVSYFGI